MWKKINEKLIIDHCVNFITFFYYFAKFQKLVVKPDQMIKRRGKLGLLKVNTDWEGVKTWLAEKRGKETTVSFD